MGEGRGEKGKGEGGRRKQKVRREEKGEGEGGSRRGKRERREKGKVRRRKGEGTGEKAEGRRDRGEGRGEKGEGQRGRGEEGRRRAGGGRKKKKYMFLLPNNEDLAVVRGSILVPQLKVSHSLSAHVNNLSVVLNIQLHLRCKVTEILDLKNQHRIYGIFIFSSGLKFRKSSGKKISSEKLLC